MPAVHPPARPFMMIPRADQAGLGQPDSPCLPSPPLAFPRLATLDSTRLDTPRLDSLPSPPCSVSVLPIPSAWIVFRSPTTTKTKTRGGGPLISSHLISSHLSLPSPPPGASERVCLLACLLACQPASLPACQPACLSACLPGPAAGGRRRRKTPATLIGRADSLPRSLPSGTGKGTGKGMGTGTSGHEHECECEDAWAGGRTDGRRMRDADGEGRWARGKGQGAMPRRAYMRGASGEWSRVESRFVARAWRA